MKKSLLIVLIFWVAMLTQPMYAQTNVSGTISKDSIWTVIGSPYKIIGNLTVALNKTLTIQPGVVVQFPVRYDGGFYLNVEGTLIAKGTSGNNIKFQVVDGSVDNNGRYISGPVKISGTSQNSVLQYVTFTGLGYGSYYRSDNTAALDIVSTSCTVNNCFFENTGGTGIFFENSTTAAVTNNTFSGNRIGIKFLNNSPSVANNSFSGNDYLDLVTNIDNVGKLKSNGSLAIGLIGKDTLAHNDTLVSAHSYRVIAALKIPMNKTLTIQPGVVVQFPVRYDGGVYLNVEGTLIAKGTSGNNIKFQVVDGSVDNNGRYISGPVKISGTSQNSVLQYVTFTGLGYGSYYRSDNTAALDIVSTSCTVNNCFFENTGGTGIFFENSTTAAVTNNTFSGNRIGIKFGNNSPSVANNSFSGNDYLDLVTNIDNVGKLKSNGSLAIGLIGKDTLAHNDTLVSAHSYRVIAALKIPMNKTLTIQPGVVVQFPVRYDGGVYLNVEGTLIAKGTSGNNIKFQVVDGSVDNNGRYISGPVKISGTSQNSVLQYVTFTGLGYGSYYRSDNTAALDIVSTSCTVNNCFFENTGGTGIFFENSTTAAVTNNTFSGNRIGIKFGNNSPSVANNSFSGNDYLDLVTNIDNVGKLKSNGSLAIGLIGKDTLAHNDTLVSAHSYRVIAALKIPMNKTLTIQPGVVVQFPVRYDGGVYLNVEGTLIAKGTSGNNIKFQVVDGSVDNNGRYISGPIKISGTSQNSVLQYVTFTGLGYGSYYRSDNTAALDIVSTSCTVNNCFFENIGGVGILFEANTSPSVSNNNFSGNTNGDITSGALSLKNLSNNSNATINVIASTINQNTTWPNPGASSKYLLKGNIIVSPTYKLTIAAGTKVLFNNNTANLIIQGALSAIGTKEDRIKFESAGAVFGGTISFDSTSKNSSLIYVSTSKLGSTVLPARSAAVELKTSSILIRNISIANSEQNGITLKKGNPTILQSSFINNKTGVLSLAGKTRFVKCSFTGNSVYGINNISAVIKDTIDARNCWWDDPTGPFQSITNPGGLGDSVSLKVLYKPFATKPFEPNDIGILSLLLPAPACDLSATEKIKVRIKNFGIEEQSGFMVSYQINKDSVVTENVGSLKIAADSTGDYTFTKVANLSVPSRSYTLKVFTALAGDTLFSNDGKVSVIKNQKPNLGKDTALKICKEGFINLWKLYDTSGYATKKWSANKPDSAGVGSFTLIVTTANGCLDTAVVTITAYDLPTPTIVAYGNTIFCKGGDVNLESSLAPAYLWSNGAVTRNIKVTESGKYSVTTRNDSGCKATSAATLVEVKETLKPTITVTKGALNLCPGTKVTLRASSSPDYYYYAWSTNDTTQSITVDTAGNYTVMVTGSNGCKNTSAAAVVTATCDKPVGLTKSQITDSSAKLSWDAVTCAVGYSLRYRKSGTSVFTTITVTGNSYTVKGLTPNTSYDWAVASICQSIPLIQSGYTNTLKFTTPAGFLSRPINNEKEMNSGKALSAVVYPVPVVNNMATLFIKNGSGNSMVRLSDVSGKLLWQMNKVADGKFVLPVEKIAAGIYIVNVFNGKENVTIKFVKE